MGGPKSTSLGRVIGGKIICMNRMLSDCLQGLLSVREQNIFLSSAQSSSAGLRSARLDALPHVSLDRACMSSALAIACLEAVMHANSQQTTCVGVSRRQKVGQHSPSPHLHRLSQACLPATGWSLVLSAPRLRCLLCSSYTALSWAPLAALCCSRYSLAWLQISLQARHS